MWFLGGWEETFKTRSSHVAQADWKKLCNPGGTGIYDPLASASQVLGLQTCATWKKARFFWFWWYWD
jgi:hypothetical protein